MQMLSSRDKSFLPNFFYGGLQTSFRSAYLNLLWGCVKRNLAQPNRAILKNVSCDVFIHHVTYKCHQNVLIAVAKYSFMELPLKNTSCERKNFFAICEFLRNWHVSIGHIFNSHFSLCNLKRIFNGNAAINNWIFIAYLLGCKSKAFPNCVNEINIYHSKF